MAVDLKTSSVSTTNSRHSSKTSFSALPSRAIKQIKHIIYPALRGLIFPGLSSFKLYLTSSIKLVLNTTPTALLYHLSEAFIIHPFTTAWSLIAVYTFALILFPIALLIDFFKTLVHFVVDGDRFPSVNVKFPLFLTLSEHRSITNEDNQAVMSYSLENLVSFSTSTLTSSDGTEIKAGDSISVASHQYFSVNVIGAKVMLGVCALLREGESSSGATASHVKLVQKANSWGLNVRFLGSGVAIFYSLDKKILILGAGMDWPSVASANYSRLDFEKVDSRAFVFGRTLRLPYEELFITRKKDTSGLTLYETILLDLDTIISTIGVNDRNNLNLWLTGTGLSGALITLLHARWLKSPSDLPAAVNWKGSYVFGSPAVGDHEFAAEFISFSNVPITFSNSAPLWRINNVWDIVPNLALSLPTSAGTGFSKESAHVGREFLMDPVDEKIAHAHFWENGYWKRAVGFLTRSIHEWTIKFPQNVMKINYSKNLIKLFIPWMAFDSSIESYYESLQIASQFVKKKQ